MRRCLFLIILTACQRAEAPPHAPRPSILLVTLDTTRDDAIGPEAKNVETPAYNGLIKHGLRFRYAYATVPQTLASHASMLTGLYPAGHGIHENGRYLPESQPLVTERLRSAGYRTAAFVSAFALARRFGLARGFDVYDEDFGDGKAERTAKETTDRVIKYLDQSSPQPLFLWVHFYDPHFPYTPPEPFQTKYAKQPYFGEVGFMDEQLGRLVDAFDKQMKGPKAFVIVADHGEGLGDHGESQHGDLLYQVTMHVPLLLIGPGITPGINDTPVSTRTIFHTILDWAGIDETNSLARRSTEDRGPRTEDVVVGEAMKPFLDYGWQPQVMAIEGRLKTILAGKIEVYDVVADPGETHDLAAQANLSRPVRAALREYPIPSPQAATATNNLDEEGRRKLASLGYVASSVKPVVRSDAPRPADMAFLFGTLDEASGLFVRQQYRQSIPLLERILSADPYNLDSALHLATAHSQLGHNDKAIAAFKKAQTIAPDSNDVRTYLALHFARTNEWQRAIPLLEVVLAKEPDRLPALEALAVIRERQGRVQDAVDLRRKIYSMRTATPAERARTATLEMGLGQTSAAIETLETLRRVEGPAFTHDLELGVLYLADGRLENAREALDRVTRLHPQYPLALFKRAQVSVLLHEPDAASRIAVARQHADSTTRDLIARERLFRSASAKPPL